MSPLTNHKNTKNGIIKGGFDRVNLFQQAELGFDKLFNYNRQPIESFDYYNTMKNSSIVEQLELQVQKNAGEKKKEIFQSSEKENKISCNLDSKQEDKHFYNQQSNSGGDSLLSIFSLGDSNYYDVTQTEESQAKKLKKKKKKGIRR